MINWDSINRISSIVTIVTPIITFLLGLKLKSIRRWYERIKIKIKIPKNSGILIVSVGENDIENLVRTWIKGNSAYRDITDDKVLTVTKLNKKITAKDVDGIIQNIKLKKTIFQQKGVSNIHLFISSPLTIAAMIGAEFSNGARVFMYNHFSKEDGYKYWGTLKR